MVINCFFPTNNHKSNQRLTNSSLKWCPLRMSFCDERQDTHWEGEVRCIVSMSGSPQWKTSTFKRCLKNEKCCMNWYFSCLRVYKPFWIWLAIWSGTYFGPLNLYTDMYNFMMWVNLGIWAIFGQTVGVKLYTQGGQTAKWQTNYINVVLSTKKKKKKSALVIIKSEF